MLGDKIIKMSECFFSYHSLVRQSLCENSVQSPRLPQNRSKYQSATNTESPHTSLQKEKMEKERNTRQ